MLFTPLVVAVAGLTSTAVATYHPEALRGLQNIKPGVAVRQEGVKCTASLVSLAASVPTPSPELSSALQQYVSTAAVTNPTAVCAVTTAFPSSLSSQYSSYDSAVSSWYNKESSDIDALISSCSTESNVQTIASVVSLFSAYDSVCASATSSGASSSTGSATAPTGSGATSSTSSSTAGAPKQTGMVAGAMAAAGFIGAVAML
ncbi:hypothetical protein SUNI508_00878 [Seiridium unicorne]|uniref:DUF7735 domain-containing protein n=1 Tax=Seiridium unicorne TaxID=138068 RepID=A0ABR2V1I5_9PEZI